MIVVGCPEDAYILTKIAFMVILRAATESNLMRESDKDNQPQVVVPGSVVVDPGGAVVVSGG